MNTLSVFNLSGTKTRTMGSPLMHGEWILGRWIRLFVRRVVSAFEDLNMIDL